VLTAARLSAAGCGTRPPWWLCPGGSLGRASRLGAWYRAEAGQLRQRRSARAGDRWQVALARGNRIVGAVKTVRLLRGQRG
jgi:hypothetical protein